MNNIWFIYRYGDEGITPHLYAITDIKELKDNFMKERDKNHFKCKKKEVDEEEYFKILNFHQNIVLWERGFRSKEGIAYLTVTEKEDMEIHVKSDDIIIQELSRYTNEISLSFKENIKEALEELMYFYIFKKYTIYDNPYPIFQDNDYLSLENMFSFKIDELSLFIKRYGYTMKK